MKKLIPVLTSLIMAFSLTARAEEHENKIELSGHVTTVVGVVADSNDTPPQSLGGPLGLIRGPRDDDRVSAAAYLDEVELDGQYSFGNHRLRFDLDFGRVLSGSGRVLEGGDFGVMVEQAYIEFGFGESHHVWVGRRNAPVGFYVVDRHANPTVTFSNIYTFLTPTSFTGAGYNGSFFDGAFTLDAYLVNQMFDCLQIGGNCLTGPENVGDNPIPSWGMRWGWNPDLDGDGERESTLGFAYIGGPEQANDDFDNLDHLLNVDCNFNFPVGSHRLTVGCEFIYYTRDVIGFSDNADFWGGLLVFDLAIGDTPWDAFLTYGYVHDEDGLVTGLEQDIHNVAIGFGYQVHDNAKIKFEARADFFNPESGLQGAFSSFSGLDIDNNTSIGGAFEGTMTF